MDENIYYVYRHFKKQTTQVVYIGRSRTLDFKRAYTLQCTQRNEDWCKIYKELGTDEKEVDEMSIEELLESYEEVFGDDDYGLKIRDRHEQFNEFTFELCPAPTYINLIK